MLRPYGLETATTNQSEAFNHVLKRLQDWKEAPIDLLVLSLFRLAQFHITEVWRGRCGQGDYILREGIEATSSETMPSVVPPQPTEIRESIRYGNNSTANEPVPSTSSPPTNDDIKPSRSSQSPPPPLSDVEPDDNEAGVSTASQQQDDDRYDLKAAERAARIIQTGQISFDPKLSIFTVNGTNEPRVVRLFPTITCSCPAKANCYHVLAAKLAIGMPDSTAKRPLNLTQLRRNKRKRADKTSARKRPRAEDVDVVPPGDHDAEETAALIAAVSGAAASSPAAAPSSPDIRTDICHACDAVQPPPRKRRARLVEWVGCDQCVRRYHIICLGMKAVPDTYVCDQCM